MATVRRRGARPRQDLGRTGAQPPGWTPPAESPRPPGGQYPVDPRRQNPSDWPEYGNPRPEQPGGPTNRGYYPGYSPTGYTRPTEWWDQAIQRGGYDTRGTGEGHAGVTFGPEGRIAPPTEFASWGERGNDRRMREKMGLPPNPASSGWHPENMPAPHGRYEHGGPKPMGYMGVEGAGYYPSQEQWHRMYPTDVGNEWLQKFGGAPGGAPYDTVNPQPDAFMNQPGYNQTDYGPGAYQAPSYQYGPPGQQGAPAGRTQSVAGPRGAPQQWITQQGGGLPRPELGPQQFGPKQQAMLSAMRAQMQPGQTREANGRTYFLNQQGALVDRTGGGRTRLTNRQGEWLGGQAGGPAAAVQQAAGAMRAQMGGGGGGPMGSGTRGMMYIEPMGGGSIRNLRAQLSPADAARAQAEATAAGYGPGWQGQAIQANDNYRGPNMTQGFQGRGPMIGGGPRSVGPLRPAPRRPQLGMSPFGTRY